MGADLHRQLGIYSRELVTLHLAGFWLGATWARRRHLEVWKFLAASAAITLLRTSRVAHGDCLVKLAMTS
ncbi:hypothetical protein HYPDE_34938 [Hyphomicrobium denitrificans 1NES1]|uniref:Uncharacterized protein n=1 Tax=Hyphomicrobium denitrificans 1NES1 TaxID=670307 RepID=N0B561_9HYPH|nr:hypothetical protein HYPDE_34938 [Hyphomicrobium denitrificans 1NES1]